MKFYAHPKIILVAALAFSLFTSARAADVTGKWKSEFETQVGQLKYTFDLKADGDKITGKAIREVEGQDAVKTDIKDGKITGDQVSFVEDITINDNDLHIEYSGKIDGDQMKLTRKVGDFGTTDIVAKREKEDVTTAVALAGKWESEFDSGVGHQKYIYDFKLDGDKITGQATRDLNDEKTTNNITGKLTGSDITFTEPLRAQDQDITVEYSGKVAGDEIKLTRKVGDFATTEIVAKRAKEAAAK